MPRAPSVQSVAPASRFRRLGRPVSRQDERSLIARGWHL
jgi:hypothetical protein